MYPLILSLLLLSLSISATNFDFNQRFGPDSHIYNTPLYFKQRRPEQPVKNHGIIALTPEKKRIKKR